MASRLPPHWRLEQPAEGRDLALRLQAIEFACSHQFTTSAYRFVAYRQIPGPPSYRQALSAGRVWIGLDATALTLGPVGFALASPSGHDLHIDELNVLPSWQGRGLASALIERLAEHARAQGLHRLTLTTFVDVAWNAPFYTRRGFAPIAPDEGGPVLRAEWQKLIEKKLDPSTRIAMALQL